MTISFKLRTSDFELVPLVTTSRIQHPICAQSAFRDSQPVPHRLGERESAMKSSAIVRSAPVKQDTTGRIWTTTGYFGPRTFRGPLALRRQICSPSQQPHHSNVPAFHHSNPQMANSGSSEIDPCRTNSTILRCGADPQPVGRARAKRDPYPAMERPEENRCSNTAPGKRWETLMQVKAA